MHTDCIENTDFIINTFIRNRASRCLHCSFDKFNVAKISFYLSVQPLIRTYYSITLQVFFTLFQL
jgi:hypothetical protein